MQMWEGRPQSRCRCGRGEPSLGADVAGASPVPVQMWAVGEHLAAKRVRVGGFGVDVDRAREVVDGVPEVAHRVVDDPTTLEHPPLCPVELDHLRDSEYSREGLGVLKGGTRSTQGTDSEYSSDSKYKRGPVELLRNGLCSARTHSAHRAHAAP